MCIRDRLSIALVLGSLGVIAFQGLNFGLDFTGGSLVEVEFPQATAPQAVRDELDAAGFVNGVVQNFGTDRDILIRMPPQDDRDQATMGDEILATLEGLHPGVEMRQSNYVGPAEGEELTESGGLAMLTALGVVMLYILFRFTGKFSIGAVVALVLSLIHI